MWIPDHRGMKGNETVDSSVKQALKHEEITDVSLSKTEAKGIVKSKELQHRQKTQNDTFSYTTVRSGRSEEGSIITKPEAGT